MDLPVSRSAGSACGGDWTGSSWVAPPLALVALPRPVCLRGDVPIVSLATQWVGKKIFSIASAGHQFYVLVSHINMPNSLKFYYLLSETRND